MTTLPRVLVADVGGTNVRFAIADLETLKLDHYVSAPCSDYRSLYAAAEAYVGRLCGKPSVAAFAVAAPLAGERIRLTNSGWSFDRDGLKASLGVDYLLLLNDFEALALSLPHLAAAALHQIGGGAPVERAAKVVVGPGTGLGVAGLAWTENGWLAIPSEGGHVSFAADGPEECALVERLRGPGEHFSVERAVAAAGLANLYRALTAQAGAPVLVDAPEVTRRAFAGQDPLAKHAIEHFVSWLGRFAGDAGLFFGARGGVYLGGGIAPKVIEALTTGRFRAAFEAKGRLSAYLAQIPVYVILAGDAGLKGAAAALSTTIMRWEGRVP